MPLDDVPDHCNRICNISAGLPSKGERERETLHLFQPPRADQMLDPLQGQD